MERRLANGKRVTLHRAVVLITLLPVLHLTACAGPPRPVLYPNEKFNAVGKEAAQGDINECIQLSVDAGLKEQKGKEVAGETAKGGARGAIVGSVIGAVSGSPGMGAAIGAAGGAASGMTKKAFDRDLDPVQKQFVDQCLRDRGYQPIGWK
jgi:Glycine-zipper domain